MTEPAITDENDLRHPRWAIPVKPEDGEDKLRSWLIRNQLAPKIPPYQWNVGEQANFLLFVRETWFSRWPGPDGLYRWGTTPKDALLRSREGHTFEQICEVARHRPDTSWGFGTF